MIFGDFMFHTTLAAMKELLTFFSDDASKHKYTITGYPNIVKYLSMSNATDAVIGKSDGKMDNFEKGLLTLSDFSKMLLHRVLQ